MSRVPSVAAILVVLVGADHRGTGPPPAQPDPQPGSGEGQVHRGHRLVRDRLRRRPLRVHVPQGRAGAVHGQGGWNAVKYEDKGDVWAQNGEIVIITKSSYSTQVGTLKDGRITGPAWNVAGRRWTWDVKDDKPAK